MDKDIIKVRIVFVYRCIFLIVCFWGLYINLGLSKGEFHPIMFVYFTIISNVVCFLFFILIIINSLEASKARDINEKNRINNALSRSRGAVTMMISVTFLIYHFVLVPQVTSTGINYDVFSLQNILAHYVVPFMVIFDWLLFAKKNAFRIYDPLIWLTIPLAYFGFTLIRAKVGRVIGFGGSNSRFPYFFIDVDALGIMRVCINAGIALLFFAFIAYLIFLIDKFNLSNGRIYFGNRKISRAR